MEREGGEGSTAWLHLFSMHVRVCVCVKREIVPNCKKAEEGGCARAHRHAPYISEASSS